MASPLSTSVKQPFRFLDLSAIAIPTELKSMGMKSMAITTCAKCEGHTFERGLITPLGEQGAVSVLRCAGCGAAIGTLDGQLVLERLQAQVAEINAGLVRIAQALSEM